MGKIFKALQKADNNKKLQQKTSEGQQVTDQKIKMGTDIEQFNDRISNRVMESNQKYQVVGGKKEKSDGEIDRFSSSGGGQASQVTDQSTESQRFTRNDTVKSSHTNSTKKRVNFSYSKTKIQTNDPENLRNNRVVSIFEDMETTNQFKILRTQVLRKLKKIGGNSILVTSANPCEGKTFTSINLGISIAKEFDRTVLIIDADIRRPLKEHTDFATEFFSLDVDKGLTDYLEGDAEIEEILINPGIDKLTLIPGGVPVDNSPELLNSVRMENMMDEIKSRYPSDRLVILDGPAILRYPDAMILYRYVDGVIPVIESEKTSSEQVKKMMEYLQEVNVLGVVLNKNRG